MARLGLDAAGRPGARPRTTRGPRRRRGRQGDDREGPLDEGIGPGRLDPRGGARARRTRRGSVTTTLSTKVEVSCSTSVRSDERSEDPALREEGAGEPEAREDEDEQEAEDGQRRGGRHRARPLRGRPPSGELAFELAPQPPVRGDPVGGLSGRLAVLEQRPDLLGLLAAPPGDPVDPVALDEMGVVELLLVHRVEDRPEALETPLGLLHLAGRRASPPPDRRKEAEELRERTHLAERVELGAHVPERELAAHQVLGGLLRLLLVRRAPRTARAASGCRPCRGAGRRTGSGRTARARRGARRSR